MRSLYLAVFLVVACVALADSDDDLTAFKAFKSEYGIKYRSRKQEEVRFANFKRSRAAVNSQNEAYQRGETTFIAGINQFSDKTFEENLIDSTGLVVPADIEKEANRPSPAEIVPRQEASRAKRQTNGAKVDLRWPKHSVRSQGSCGSCWAFTTATALEYAFKTDLELSQQDFVDCDKSNGGCRGGFYNSALAFAKRQGIAFNSVYQYKSGKTGKSGTCNVSLPRSFNVSSIKYKWLYSAEEMKTELKRGNPVPVALEVTAEFYRYKSGIYHTTNCTGKVNHAVLAVGYGMENNTDYWLIENSWGSGWGDKGYMKIRNGTCKINEYAISVSKS